MSVRFTVIATQGDEVIQAPKGAIATVVEMTDDQARDVDYIIHAGRMAFAAIQRGLQHHDII